MRLAEACVHTTSVHGNGAVTRIALERKLAGCIFLEPSCHGIAGVAHLAGGVILHRLGRVVILAVIGRQHGREGRVYPPPNLPRYRRILRGAP